MIAYVHGEVVRLELRSCVVDVNGIGYRLQIPASTRERLALGDQVTLYTYLQVLADSWTLYGFYTEAEAELHTLLLGVSGIGARIAAGIVGAMTPAAFYEAIRRQNKEALMQLPGIGKKSAERLLLELKDKIGAVEPETSVTAATFSAEPVTDDAVAETIRALIGLGYTAAEVAPTAERLSATHETTETLLPATLAALGKGRR